MSKSPRHEICRRIASIRTELTGTRGKSAFARMLGLSPSTYDYYESNRVPPADVLVRIADTAGVDLRWLLTGQEAATTAVPADHPAVQRVAKLLAGHPDAARPLGSFLDILTETISTFPDAGGLAGARTAPQPRDAKPTEDPARARREWIPVLGRSAAGVPQFWDLDEPTEGLTTLTDLIDRHVGAVNRGVRAASAQAGRPGRDENVRIIALSRPDEGEPAEFVVAANVKQEYPDAFAVRIDGESMAPDIRHGDVLLLSPSRPAVDGQAAVVQLAGQIGVTCKLFRRRGEQVHLVPVNEHFQPTAVPAAKVLWALRAPQPPLPRRLLSSATTPAPRLAATCPTPASRAAWNWTETAIPMTASPRSIWTQQHLTAVLSATTTARLSSWASNPPSTTLVRAGTHAIRTH
ncbi:MAG: helix-turn-helix domain-containing protein [Phycisphaerae bacterium]